MNTSTLGFLLLLVAGSTACAQVAIDGSWTFAVGGRAVEPLADGSFRIANVAAPDLFGEAGPGSLPDGVSDDFLRVIGTTTRAGTVWYAYSPPFQLQRGATHIVDTLVISTQPPPIPASITISSPLRTLTAVGAVTQLSTVGTLPDGSLLDVTSRSNATIYRSSNQMVARVGPHGLVTAVGSGTVFITAANSGAAAVYRIVVSPGDPLTRVEGIVHDTSGQPIVGASVAVRDFGETSSGPGGRFSIPGVPAQLGPIDVSAGAGSLLGSAQATPLAGAITDVGAIVLSPSSAGTEFLTCFQANFGGTGDLSLAIASEFSASGIVEIPGLGFSQSFTTPPGDVVTVDLPSSATTLAADGIEALGVSVTTNAPVTITGLNIKSAFSRTGDGFRVLPTSMAGTRFRVMAYTPVSFSKSQFAVVGIEDATSVTITPATSAGASPVAGLAYTVTLDRYEVYQLRAASDLTGTLVTSDRPVTVLSGNDCTAVAALTNCDHLVEQLLPVNVWGESFQSVDLASRSAGDTFRILADQDGTQVTIESDSTETFLLDAGQFAERLLDGGTRFSASHPVLVAQFANGGTFDNTEGDPVMMILTPDASFRRSYRLTTPLTGFSSHFANVTVPASHQDELYLDGAPVVPWAVFDIGDGADVGIQVVLTPGQHVFTSAQPFGLYVYGFDLRLSYAYTGGF